MKIKKMQSGWHLLLLCAMFLLLMPTVFAVSNSLKTMQDAFNTVFQIIPARPTTQNCIHVLSKLSFLRTTMNTFLIAAAVTIFKTVTSLFAAYSSVCFDFRGKGTLYFIMLATILIPFIVTMTPNYLMISKIRFSDKIWGVASSQLADVLGISLLRQSMRGIPRALIEAIRMENVKNLKIMRNIIISLVRPFIIFTGIIFFTNSWNEHVWSVLILKGKENYILPLALQMYISAEGGAEFAIAMAISVMTMMTPLALYILFQRYTINASVMSGTKGQNVSENSRSKESDKEKQMKNTVLDHVVKAYDRNVIAEDLNMEIGEGERLILLGSSGCGKSITPWMTAGLEKLSGGSLYMDGRLVNDVPCGERNVSMVFQNCVLFPHMTVQNNIIYGLKAHKMDPAEVKVRFSEVLDMLDLKGLEDRRPKDLSGDRRQRVALARAVVKRLDYFLLDEPLSNLNAQLGLRARKELVKIHKMYHQTFIYVTHSRIGVMTMGQCIILMHEGKMQMLDTPSDAYDRPINVFTIEFIGSPSMNIVEASYTKGTLVIERQVIWLSDMWSRLASRNESGRLFLGVRLEYMVLLRRHQDNTLEGIVKYVEDHGNRYGVYVQVDNMESIAVSEGDIPAPGENVYTQPDFDRIHLFDRTTQISPGYPEQLRTVKEPHTLPKVARKKGENDNDFVHQYQYV